MTLKLDFNNINVSTTSAFFKVIIPTTNRHVKNDVFY